MIDDGEFYQRNRKFFDHYILKNSHQRDFVAHLQPNVVAEKRSTFSRANVFAEVLRQIHGVRFASADDRMAVVERTVGLALAEVLLISAPELAHTPARFARPDGTAAPENLGIYAFDGEWLILDGDTVTDKGLEQLAKIPSLNHVRLKGTKVTQQGITELKRALPAIEVNKYYGSPNKYEFYP